jgi:SAM-dependent methyltransferase
MSSDERLILEAVPEGSGLVLDLGGNKGLLRAPLKKLGYQYVNLDCQHFGSNEPTLIGDAHRLCFKDGTFSIIVSKCTFEHFSDPWRVAQELHRVLKDGGRCIVWVPFMHPFHADDYYRYTPLGLRHIFQDFAIIRLESPAGIFTILGTAGGEIMRRIGLARFVGMFRPMAHWLDRLMMRGSVRPMSYAAAYRIVLEKVSVLSLDERKRSEGVRGAHRDCRVVDA